MARPIRVQFDDAVYHVTARGNERKPIYRDDRDRLRFLETLASACGRFGLIVHAYCLMANHYHLVVQTPRANLCAAVGWLQTTYSVRFNFRHRRTGHLFQGRYRSIVVDADEYAIRLILYIHLNPVRPRDKSCPIPIHLRHKLAGYQWSSHAAYAGTLAAGQPHWLCLQWLDYFGANRAIAHKTYRQQIAEMFGQVPDSPWAELQNGLVLGASELQDRVKLLVGRKSGQEEARWARKANQPDVAAWVERQVAVESDRRIQIWLRTELGGESRTAVARSYGYRDPSAITRIMSRVARLAGADKELAKRLEAYRMELSRVGWLTPRS